jgi:hypothetical protein
MTRLEPAAAYGGVLDAIVMAWGYEIGGVRWHER